MTVDYNSWVESDKSRKLVATLDKDIVLAEGMCFKKNVNTISVRG